MKTVFTILALLTVGQLAGTCQTAEDLIAQGRAFMTAHDPTNANNRFSSALALAPNHATGNVFRAATRLLSLPYQPAAQGFLDRLGFAAKKRDIYAWTAGLPRNTNGDIVLPNNVSVADIFTFLRTNLTTEVIAASTNLALVTSTNFLLTLRSNETTTVAVTLDYGDVLMLRAALKAFQYWSYTVHSWNLDYPLTSLPGPLEEGETMEDFLTRHPGLLTFATTNDLVAARVALGDAFTLYLGASTFIQNRPTNVTRLFNLDRDSKALEASFRATLSDLNQSLNGPITLSERTNLVVSLKNHFNGLKSPRNFFPKASGEAFIAGSLPDSTFGGVVDGVAVYKVEEFLGERFHLSFLPQFAPPQRLSAGRLQMSLNALQGSLILIEASPDGRTWTNYLAGPVIQGKVSFVDTNTAAGTRHFYRAGDWSWLFP